MCVRVCLCVCVFNTEYLTQICVCMIRSQTTNRNWQLANWQHASRLYKVEIIGDAYYAGVVP